MALKINNRAMYTVDDYLRDRNQPAQNVRNNNPLLMQYTQPKAQSSSGSRLDRVRLMAAIDAESKNAVYGPPTPNSSVVLPRWMTDPPVTQLSGGTGTETETETGTETGTGTGTGTGSEEIKDEVNSMFTTNLVDTVMNEVLKGILDFANRKFEYKPKESPLYSILQQQAAKEARIASGRAYSRAVANAGGFGSSYATLAAEEASRQVMEGWDDNQLALYQAAKEEWDSQWTSKLQQYQALQSIYGTVEEQENKQKAEANAEALGMNQDTYDLLVQAGQENWYDGRDESTLRTLLTNAAAGNPNIDVEAIVNRLTGKTDTTETPGTQVPPGTPGAIEPDKPLTPKESEAATLLSTTFGMTYSPESMRALLQSRAYTSDEIEVALGVQKNLARGTVLDTVVTDLDGALAYGKTLNIALSQGLLTQAEYKAAQTKNSAIIKEDILRQVDKAPSDKAAETPVDNAADYVKDGLMSVQDFEEILTSQTAKALKTMKTEAGNGFNTLGEVEDLIVIIQGWMEYRDKGAITNEDIINSIASMRDNETLRAVYEKIHRIAYYGNEDNKDKIARLSDDGNKAMQLLFSALDPYCTWDSRRKCTWKTQS